MSKIQTVITLPICKPGFSCSYLPKIATMKFRVTDSSLNSYGFRILTSGIDFSLFDTNPIMLWMHNRPYMKDDPLPLGKWQNRGQEGDAVTMEAVFDEKDDFAQKIKSKAEQGIINMASIGIDNIDTSMDPALMLPGQTRPTVTKCLLKEVSLVDIGGNNNALKMYKNGVEITLSDGTDNDTLPLIKINNMKPIAIKLGLSESATEDQILSKIGEIMTENATLKGTNTDLTATLKGINDEKCATLVDEAIASKKITADKKETFMKMAASDFDTCKAVLASMPAQIKPSDLIAHGGKGAEAEKDDWKTLTSKGSDVVLKLKTEDPEKYRKLYREHYGFEPKE